ncbi:glycosyltransferase family 39 protein, partial [bacterium]|nr:glycosyltransferase family 39 protein [candidate division CSSED10-310 bacterium]
MTRDGRRQRHEPAAGIAVVLLIAAAYFGLAFYKPGFADYHRYGRYSDVTMWISLIAPKELTFFITYLAAGIATVLLLVRALRATRLPELMDRLAGNVERRQERTIVTALTVVALAAVAACTILSHDGTPLTDDEWVYRFQARVLAAGMLTAPLPGPPDFFRNQYMVVTDRLYSQYAFGHSALLAAGAVLGAMGVVPVLLAGCAVAFTYGCGRLLLNRRGGLLAACLLLFSPQFLLTQGTIASQSSIAALVAAFFFFLLRAVRHDSRHSAFAAGLVWGWALQTRPIDTMIVALGAVAILLHRPSGRTFMALVPIILWLAVGAAITGGLYLATNWLVNGGPLTTNYNPLWKDHPSGATSAF